jgi:hypothetical protein
MLHFYLFLERDYPGKVLVLLFFQFYSTYTANTQPRKLLKEVIHTVKYADDIVLLAKEETTLQVMSDRPI